MFKLSGCDFMVYSMHGSKLAVPASVVGWRGLGVWVLRGVVGV